jgi:hypothetical protein
MMATHQPSDEELERWFRSPESWTGLSAAHLQRLLATQVAWYGATNDASRVPLLRRLYEHAVSRISVADRLELLQATTELVERRQLSVNSLLPFIITDPEHVVVSTAALNLAVLMPLKDGDPLTGPRYLLESLKSTDDATVQVGVLSALLLLGDRRVVKLLDRCWEHLDHDSRINLTHARSGNLFAAVVDFYLDWLDSLDDHTAWEEYGAVAAALTRMPKDANQGFVTDVQRKFPANAADGQPEIKLLDRWTIPEFGRRIEPRLRPIHAREREPRITSHIFRAWNLPVPAEPAAQVPSTPSQPSAPPANAAPDAGSAERSPGLPFLHSLRESVHREQASSGQAWVGMAVEPDDWKAAQPRTLPLLTWGIFNPFGPTVVRIELAPLPDHGEYLVVRCQDHPFTPEVSIFGTVPDKAILTPGRLLQILKPLFEANGVGEHILIGEALPSHVVLSPRDLLPPHEVETLYRLLAARTDGTDTTREVELLRRFAGRPWERVSESLKELAQRRPTDTQVPRPPTESEFELWWKAVTDTGHVQAELQQMEAARQGAIEHLGAMLSGAGRPPSGSGVVGFVAAVRRGMVEFWTVGRALLPWAVLFLLAFVGWDVYKGFRDGVGDAGWILHTARSLTRNLSLIATIWTMLLLPEYLLHRHAWSIYDGGRVRWDFLIKLLGVVLVTTAAVATLGTLLTELARSWPDLTVRGGRVLSNAYTAGIISAVYCAFRANTAGEDIRKNAGTE